MNHINRRPAKTEYLHLLDTERIFAYRALRIGRKDATPLPGYEQDDYVPSSEAALRSPESIIEEYKAVRAMTIQLFKNLPATAYEANWFCFLQKNKTNLLPIKNAIS